jgi:hypothetical protein
MAWPFKKPDETNGEKKPDEQNKAEIDALVERLGASFEEKIKPLRDEFGALKTEWDGIKAAATPKPDPNVNADGTELTDEQKAARARNATIAIAVTANARLTESEVISELAAKWGKFIPKIKEYFANTPIERKAQPDYPEYCRNIAKMVIGDAAISSGLSYGQDNKFFLEDSVTRTGDPDSPLNDSDLTWTDPRSGKVYTAGQQLAKLGIDAKEFSENLRKGLV